MTSSRVAVVLEMQRAPARQVPSWFVRVEEIKDRLVERNTETYWVPPLGTWGFRAHPQNSVEP